MILQNNAPLYRYYFWVASITILPSNSVNSLLRSNTHNPSDFKCVAAISTFVLTAYGGSYNYFFLLDKGICVILFLFTLLALDSGCSSINYYDRIKMYFSFFKMATYRHNEKDVSHFLNHPILFVLQYGGTCYQICNLIHYILG